MRIAMFGGIYNNYLALEAAIVDARNRSVDSLFCLGDLGAFGPYPDRVFPLIYENDVQCIQGNYDDSIGNNLEDCQCGYTDPQDNLFAQISYDYTNTHTSDEHREWMRTLPSEHRFEFDDLRVLFCHGSPRKVNEFLWESTTSTQFLSRLAHEHQADIICGTHTGIHWERHFGQGKRFVNVGVLGRPENDGKTHVWYTLLSIGCDAKACAEYSICMSKNEIEVPVSVEFVPISYDHDRLSKEMQDEGLPEEFIETIQTGWWTTCLEVLPSKERRVGKY